SRNLEGRTLVIEDIPPVGIVAEENDDIRRIYPRHEPKALKRVTFWNASFTSENDLSKRTSEELLGYAILKRDFVPDHPKHERKAKRNRKRKHGFKAKSEVRAAWFMPADGLEGYQITAVLSALGITFDEIDYERLKKKFRRFPRRYEKIVRDELPYQKFLYAG